MIISRYLTREVLITLLSVTFVLLLAFLSQQVVRYLNYIVVGKIPTNVLLQIVSYEIPYLTAFLLPLGLFLGILLAYGRLYANHEMSIMQMYGYGFNRIFRLTLFIALAVAGIVLILMLWVNPWISARRQELMTSDAATLHLVQTLMPGRFQVSPDGQHVMYVEKLSRDRKRAQNIFLAQTSSQSTDQPVWMLVLANAGYQINDKRFDEPFFVTTNGYRYEGVPGQRDYKIIKFEKYAVRIPKNDIHVTHKENETLSTWQLMQDYKNRKRAAEFQWRFSIAISAIVLAFLALSFSRMQLKQAKYLSIIPAILLYIIYIDLLFIARRWVEQGVVPISIGMWWVHGIMIVFILLGVLLKNYLGVTKFLKSIT